ncbi:MAG: hypothetical protein ACOYXC_02365 [Candidatus Rifleibacteriota bacterium]
MKIEMPISAFKSRRGSIILIVVGILLCLFIFALGYSKFLSQQTAMSDKMRKNQGFSSIARALATIAAHKLQFSPQVMDNPGCRRAWPEQSPYLLAIFNYLALPFDEMETVKIFPLPLDEDATPHLSMLIEPLWQAAGYGDNLEESISLVIDRNDFTACGTGLSSYNREKTGYATINVILDVKNQNKIVSSFEFNYSCQIRVTTSHIPVLSKFNLYVEDASISTAEHEFAMNQVSVDELGNLARSRTKAVPLVLNNDDHQNLGVKPSMRDFVDDARGLVYLGGNSILYLNLARSDVVAPSSDSGEGFHFFRRENFDGTYPVLAADHSDGRHLLLSRMNLGVSDDPGERSASFYNIIESGMPGREQVEQGRCRLSSIFRLAGIEKKHSPTLVLGNVMSQYLSISLLYDSSGRPANPPVLKNLSYAPTLLPPNYYIYEIVSDGYADLRAAFGLGESPADYVRYIKEYAPRVRQRPYNAGLAFMLQQDNADAISLFPEEDPLRKLMKSPDSSLCHKIPGSFAAIFPGEVDLKRMQKFMAIGDYRVAYRIDNEGGENLLDLLRSQCLVSRERVALSGWVRCKNGFKISRLTEFVSGGGIIVENGDIVIENSFLPSDHRDSSLIYLVTLNGNIVLGNSPDQQVQAGLIAYSDGPEGGRVIFDRPPKSIRGAIAMKRMFKNVSEVESFKGTELTYFSSLSALPAKESENSGDSNLINCSFSLFPQELP